MALLLREADVKRLADLPAIVEAVAAAMRELGEGVAQNQPRRRVFAPGALLNVMFAAVPGAGYMGVKSYSVGRSGVRFLVTLFDLEGTCQALIEADQLGANRTGAATAVAVRALRGGRPLSVGLIGSGHQGRMQARALLATVEVSELRIFSPTAERREALASELGGAARAAGSARQAVEGVDVVVTMTTAADPVLEAGWVRDDALVVGAGSNFPNRAELPPELVGRSAVVVDQLETAQLESGDLHRALEAGAFEWTRALELGAILAGDAPAPGGATVFESHGLALWDVAAGAVVLAAARAAGAGEEVALL